MKKVCRNFVITGSLFLAFVLFTALVMNVDVRPIGPRQTSVGLAAVNQFMYERLGRSMLWYTITDWLGVAAIVAALGFGVLGMVQWIKRKSLWKVDRDIVALGMCYLLVIAVYALFECFIVNYRPVIIGKGLETSYPSSHTMGVICVMATAAIQFQRIIGSRLVRRMLIAASVGISAVTIMGRILSGVHWFTDIVAGALLGAALVMLYYSVIKV